MKNITKFCIFLVIALNALVLNAIEPCKDRVFISYTFKAPNIVKPRAFEAAVAIFGKDIADKVFEDLWCVSEKMCLSNDANICMYLLDFIDSETQKVDLDLTNVKFFYAIKVDRPVDLHEYFAETEIFCKSEDCWVFCSTDEELLENSDLKAMAMSCVDKKIDNDIEFEVSLKYLTKYYDNIKKLVSENHNGTTAEDSCVDKLDLIASLQRLDDNLETFKFVANCDAEKIEFGCCMKARPLTKIGIEMLKWHMAEKKLYMYDVIPKENLIAQVNVARIYSDRIPLDIEEVCNVLSLCNSGVAGDLSKVRGELNSIILQYCNGDYYCALTNDACACTFIGLREKTLTLGSFAKNFDEIISKYSDFKLIDSTEGYKDFVIYSTNLAGECSTCTVAISNDVYIECCSMGACGVNKIYDLIDMYRQSKSKECINTENNVVLSGYIDVAQYLKIFCGMHTIGNTSIKVNFNDCTAESEYKLNCNIKNSDMKRFFDIVFDQVLSSYLANDCEDVDESNANSEVNR